MPSDRLEVIVGRKADWPSRGIRMKTILGYLKDHFQTEGTVPFYIAYSLALIVAVAVNYHLDFETRYIGSFDPGWRRVAAHFCFYGVPYYVTLLLYSIFCGKTDFWRNRGFLLTSFIGLLLFSIYSSTSVHQEIAGALAPRELHRFTRKCAYNIVRPVVAVIPLLLLWLAMDRKILFKVKGRDVTPLEGQGRNGYRPFLYGFGLEYFDWKIYALMLAIIAPLIVGASFGEDFISYYPRYFPTSEPETYNIPGWVFQLLFELCYGVDFVFTELFFRGFLIIGMIRYLGKGAVPPMVAWYAFIHFNKPLLETVGSVFGGFILGVIAYRTLSIYGGVMIHLGVAYLMEIAAIGQRLADRS